jgi:phage protein D
MRGGVDITDHFNDRTVQIKVELIAGGGEGDHCVIKLDDRDWRIAAVEPGETINIYLGYQEIGLSYMGSFEIDDVTYLGKPRSIQLTGTSTGFMNVQKAPAIKEFDNKSVADILGGIAGQTGLSLQIGGGLGAMTLPFKNQVVSNLHLIHELERQYGAMAKIADGKLIFVPRDGTTSVTGLSVPTLVLMPEHFGDWQVQYSGRTDYASTKAAWFDKKDMVRRWVDFGAQGGGGVGKGSGGTYTLGQVFNSMEEAQAAVQSKMQALKRAEVKATFDLAKGDPWIHDTQTVLVSGMRDKIDGSYVVEKAIHTYIKTTGIRTTLECRAPGNGADFSDRADDEFLKPLPGEPMGSVIPDGTFNGSVPF